MPVAKNSVSTLPPLTPLFTMSSVHFDGLTWTVYLDRERFGGKVIEEHVFGEHDLSVHACSHHELTKIEKIKIKGEPINGMYYYILAKPYDGLNSVFLWLNSKEEAEKLLEEIDAANFS